MLNYIFDNKLFAFLPLIMIAHILLGVCAILHQGKKMDWLKLPNYMKNGTLFFSFLALIEVFYRVGEVAIGEPLITFTTSLRAISWFGVMIYYFKQIYDNMVILGLPRIKKIEEEMDNSDNVEKVEEALKESIVKKEEE